MNLRDILIKERRRVLARNKKPLSRYTRLKWLLPRGEIRRYTLLLNKYIDDIYDVVKDTIIAQLPSVIKEKDQEQALALDSYVDSLDRLIETMTLRLQSRETLNTRTMLLNVGQRTAKWNNKEWQKIVRSAFGVPTLQRESWLNDRLTLFTNENVALIKSIDEGLLTGVESTVRRGLDDGLRIEAIGKNLEDKFFVQKKRAKFIARDQISKLNGKLTEERQTAIGVEMYVWETSDDERVRRFQGKSTKGHRFLDGKYCRWDDPTVYSEDEGKTWVKRPKTVFHGHPGQDFQCRCWARPVFAEYADLDN